MNIPGYHIQKKLKTLPQFSSYLAIEDNTNIPVQLIIYSSEITDALYNQLEIEYSDLISFSDHGLIKIYKCFKNNNQLIIATEYFNATPLNKQTSFSDENVIEIIINLTKTINFLNKNHIIINNLNPGNIYLSESTHDLKIDISTQPLNNKISYGDYEQENPLSTLAYISPEMTHRINRSVDYRSNFYSLGIIFYELLCGKLPYKLSTSEALKILHAHIAQTADNIKQIRPDIATSIAAIINKLLEKMPEQRYQSGKLLLKDLQYCLDNINNPDTLDNYKIAQNDLPETFNISEKLFGREQELETLKNIVNNINSHSQQSLFISGAPGSGKSAFVNEIKQHVYKDNVLIAEGKFEQYDRNTPFIAFKQIFSSITEQILLLSAEELDKWKSDIKDSLGDNLSILIKFHPQIKSIIGDMHPSDLTSASNTDQLHRFNNTIIRFLTLLTKKQPLIFIIDDIQWADKASFEFFSTLIKNASIKNLLTISTFRDNDPHAIKNINKLKEELHSKNHKHTNINLDGLTEKDIDDILSASFIPTEDNNINLASNIYTKTSGNPFFIHQLLLASRKDKKIFSNTDLNDTHLDHYSNNIFELIRNRFSSLDSETQNTLQVFSCIGSATSVSFLSNTLKLSENTISAHLKSAESLKILTSINDKFRFQHDRIQQTINESIDEDIKLQIHKRIGSTLFNNIENDSDLFSAVNHYNKALPLFSEIDEKNKLREINTTAAKQSITGNAYSSAYYYANTARQLLSTKTPDQLSPSTYNTLYQYARACFLTGKQNQALNTASHLLSKDNSTQNIVACFSLYKDIVANLGEDYSLAVNALSLVFERLSIDISPDTKTLKTHTIPELQKEIQTLLDNKSINSLANSKFTVNPELRTIMQFLMDAWEAAYYAGNSELMQVTILKMVQLSLTEGICSESSFGFVVYALILSLQGEIKNASAIGNLSLEINNHFDDKVLLPKVTNLYCNYINFYTNSFIDSAKRYERSALHAENNGDFLFGVWATCFIVWSYYLGGENLLTVKKIALEHKNFVDQTSDLKMQKVYSMLEDTIHQLTYVDNINTAPAERPDYDKFLNFWKDNQFLPGPTWYAILQSYTHYLSGEFETALSILSGEAHIDSIDIIMFPATQLNFIHALCLAAVFRHRNPNQQKNFIIEIESLLESISTLSQQSPDNFKYQELLITAELCRIKNDPDAESYYQQSILECNKSGIIQNIALSYELFGRYLSKDSFYKAQDYIIQAIEAYSYWGAERKVYLLISEFRHLLPTNYSLNSHRNHHSDNLSDLALITDTSLDLSSILKTTQSISSITDTNELLRTIMSIILEEAGAERGIFIIRNENDYYVEAEAHFDKTVLHNNIPLSDFDDISHSIVRYCIRTNDKILLSNAEKTGAFTTDLYVQTNHLKSVVCTPFYHQDELYGLLYLENSLSEDAFSLKRLSIIHIILTQAVISLENSMLYSSLHTQIQETRQAENDLRISEERMKRSHLRAKTGTWDWDIVTGELYWSDSIGPIFGFEEKELETSYENFMAAIHPDDRKLVQKAIDDCIEDGADYQVNHRIVLPDGTIRWVSEAGDALRDSNNNAVKMFGVVQDITNQIKALEDQQNLQKQLQQAQKMESIGLLTGGIAHDFNNILAAVIGYTDLAITNLTTHPTEKINGYLRRVMSAGDRAAGLVEQLLSFSRGTSIDPVSLNPKPVVKESIKLLHSTIPSNIQLSSDIDESIPNIMLDAVQLQQLVMNLCINARDSITNNGTINISLQTVTYDNLRCSSCSETISGELVELSVTDSGSGIPSNILDQVFEPFFTTKEFGKGSGMGLSIVHGITHNNNGHILINSDDNGTTIKLLFEISEPQSIPITNTGDTLQGEGNQQKILIIDDEEFISTYLKELLELNDYDTVTINNSQQAKKLFLEKPDDFDLVITDMAMPELTGDILAKSILAVRPDIPIILCTGYSSIITEQISKEIGISHFMKKPVNPNELLSTIASLLS